jgi:hypothetical protein
MTSDEFLQQLFALLAGQKYQAVPIKVYANNGTFEIQRVIISEDDGTIYVDVTNTVDLDATPV